MGGNSQKEDSLKEIIEPIQGDGRSGADLLEADKESKEIELLEVPSVGMTQQNVLADGNIASKEPSLDQM